jgi:CheY-like chemotaxis protein
VRTAGSTGTVLADQGQIEQVVLNLAVNARDAMPRGGRLIIEAADVDLDEAFAGSHATIRPGPYLRITVRDTGQGMSADVQARIFEPFFTTKASGKGTGLGLATVYAIVEQSGGTIWVTSTVGEGTTFTIYLPRIAAVAVTDGAPPAVTPGQGRGTILLVEDDDAVRELAAAILKSAGYVTLSANRAIEALHTLAVHHHPIDLIVTDVVLPGMGGREMAGHAAAIAPGIPVLFTSGHTDDLVLAHGVREHTVNFLAKPYTPRALCNKIAEILAGRAGERR